jgi:death on curing protein
VTFADVVVGHELALMFGGRAGVLNEHSIHSAIGRPYSGYHRFIAEKAAALTEALARNHGFVDGNKRTAVYAMGLLLTRSGYKLRDDNLDRLNREVEDMIVAVAHGHPGQRMSYDALVEWFRARIVRSE